MKQKNAHAALDLLNARWGMSVIANAMVFP